MTAFSKRAQRRNRHRYRPSRTNGRPQRPRSGGTKRRG